MFNSPYPPGFVVVNLIDNTPLCGVLRPAERGPPLSGGGEIPQTPHCGFLRPAERGSLSQAERENPTDPSDLHILRRAGVPRS